MIGFLEEVEEMVGRTIAATWTRSEPYLIVLFTDGTAAIIEEDRSGCYYAGDHGGMTVCYPPEDWHRTEAEKLLNGLAKKGATK